MANQGADGKVVFEYTGDTSGIDKANSEAEQKVKSGGSKIQGSLDETANKAGKTAENATKKSSGVLSAVSVGIGTAFGGIISQAGGALVDFGKKGIELASNLNEVQNVVDTTFGANAKAIDSFSKSAGKNFGLSELDTKKYSSTLGALFKSMGETPKATLAMSEGLTGLSGDIASFYNLNPEDAFNKLRSGISGETEPLKELGINMTDANLSAFALTKGIKGGTKSMTQAQLATLRYQYIMNATKDAQGDFSKTSGSFANQQRQVSMQLDTLAATIGTALLPILSQLMTFVATLFGPLGQLVSAILAPVGQLLQALMPPLTMLLNALIPPLIAILNALVSGPLTTLIQTLMPGIVALIQFIAQVITALVPVITWLANVLSQALVGAFQALSPVINAFVSYLKAIIQFVKDVFAGNWGAVWRDVMNIFSSLWNGFTAILKAPLNAGISLLNAFISGLNKIRLPDWMGGGGVSIPLIPHLAKGGLAFGPTVAMVGDNKNARHDPEVVSPLSKLQSYISESIQAKVSAAPANVTVIVQPAPVNLDGKTIANNTAAHQFASAAIKGMKQ